MPQAVHGLIDAGLESSNPPLAVIREEALGLIGIAECSGRGADARAAAQIVLDAVRTHVGLHHDTIDRFRQQPSDVLRNDLITVLKEATVRAGREAFALQRRKKVALGVSLDLLVVIEREAFAAHVGLGQVYLLRRGLLHRLTLTTPNNTASAPPVGGTAPDANQPLQLLGTEPNVHVETLCLSFSAGDRILICSPGLATILDDREIRTLSGALPAAQAIQGLMHLAREKSKGEPLGLLVYQVPGEPPATRAQPHNRLAILSRIPLFNYCTPEELLVVAAVTQPMRVPRGSMVFQQGSPGQEIYLIVSGEVMVVRDGAQLARLGSGSNFGEMSVLDEPIRSATVVAIADTELLVIRKEAFFSLLMGNPTLAVKILWNMLLRLSETLRSTSSKLAEVQGMLTPAQPPTDTQPRNPIG